jgi:TonB family protein
MIARRILCVAICLSLAVLTPAVAQTPESANKTEARTTFNSGVKAFRENNSRGAVDFFTRAMQLDPDLMVAEFYLATAYASMYKPGDKTPENLESARKGVEIFERVVQREPSNVEALSSLGNLYSSTNDFEKAREVYLRVTKLATQDPKPFYTVASIDWLLVRNKAKPPTEAQIHRLIAEGNESVDIALALNPEYQEAMTYKNLLLREQAARTSDTATRDRLLREADSWFQKALDAVRQQQTQKESVAAGVGAPPPPAPAPQRIGSVLAPANLIKQVSPIYPPEARAARVQGVVLLQVKIEKQGSVANVQVVSGHPLLTQAAIDAVNQWRYQPVLLNGEPIEVITTVTVNFVMQ